jgi:hypothetical protein
VTNYNLPIITLANLIGLPDACGPISQGLLTAQSTPESFSWLTLDENSIVVSDTKIGDAGTYNVELFTTLINYPGVTLKQQVTIII